MKPERLVDHFQLETRFESRDASTIKGKPLFKGELYERLDDGFGNPILKKVGDNTVVVGGAIAALQHLCNVNPTWKPATLNQIYNLNADVVADDIDDRILLFGVGTGGSGLAFGSVVEKDIKSREVPDFIPLRTGTLISGDDANKYYFKKPNGDGTFSWYLKEFSVDPVIKTCWKDSADDETDGTEVTSEIYDSGRTEGLQTFAEFILDFNTKDVREYSESIGMLDSARYNTIGLFTGQKVRLEDGSYDYVNVRLFSYLNIDNKSVKIKTASQYVYRILSLV